MKSFDKESFLSLLKFRPQWLIGREIIHEKKPFKILDISISGDCLRLEGPSSDTKWIRASRLEDSVIIDNIDMDKKSEPFTVLSVIAIIERIESLEKSVGHSDSE